MTEDDGVTFRQYSYDNLNQLKTELFYDKVSGVGEYKWYSVSSSGNVAFIAFNYNNGTYTTSYSSGQGYGSGTDWKELMTSFGGTPITYDANGNPLSYCNGQSYTFTWHKGRQLASAVTGTNTISYSYDVSGLRISKTVNGTTHTYTYDGSLLLCDKWGSQYIEYFYDATGKPYALRYYDGILPTKYYFTKNIEGDILELRSSANTLVARYIYDDWGKLLEVRDASGNAITSSTHIANLNSLRYRGYFYDTETKLYYLQSRYYDPQAQRFISPDVYISTGQGIIGYNMFAYCNNNSVNKQDNDGTDPGDLKDTIDDAAIDAAGYMAKYTLENGWEYATAIYSVSTTIVSIRLITKTYRLFGRKRTIKYRVIVRTTITKYTYKKVVTDKDSSKVREPRAPLFRKRVAIVHTHPKGGWEGITTFSPKDEEVASKLNILVYVHGPDGTLRRLDPATREDEIVHNSILEPW